MKRKMVKSLLCAVLMAAALSVTACGGSDAGSESEAPEVEAPVQEEAEVVDEEPAVEEAPEEEVPEEETQAPEETAAPEEAPAAEEAPAEEEAASDVPAGGSQTLEEYLMEDPTAEQQLQDQAASMGNEMMDMSIEVVDNEVFCVGTLKDSVEFTEDVENSLRTVISGMEPAFSAIAGVLDGAIGAEAGTVSYGVRYCDQSGNVLIEESFHAN